MRRQGLVIVLLISMAAVAIVTLRTTPTPRVADSSVAHHGLVGDSGKTPILFEANVGQSDPEVEFVARTATGTMFLTRDQAIVAGPLGAVGLRFEGAKAGFITPARPKSTAVNYIRGSDPGGWHLGVPVYGEVRYGQVYPGVDVLYHGARGGLEYDVIVAPGADPDVVTVVADGADSLRLAPDGDLLLGVGQGELRQQKPTIYQDVDGRRRYVPGAYELGDGNRFRFAVGPYDRDRALVIDPVLSYSTYLGSNGDEAGTAIVVDSGGNSYVTGATSSTTFPTAGPAQAGPGGSGDAFVAKLNASGSALAYATYLGGSAGDGGFDIAVDTAGNAYVAGFTDSPNFPTTPGVVGGAGSNSNGRHMGFVTKLTPSGALGYSTYLGGSVQVGTGNQDAVGIEVDGSGNAHVVGTTSFSDFPTTAAFQAVHGGREDIFVSKLNSSGSGFIYSTFLGSGAPEDGIDIALDSAGNAYVVGAATGTTFPGTAGSFQPARKSPFERNEAVVAKFAPSGSLVYASWLGGSEGSSPNALTADSSGNAYVVGTTGSTDFPVAGQPFQAERGPRATGFVTKINPGGSALVYSTYLGGTDGTDNPKGVVVDGQGNAYIGGSGASTDHPLKDPIQSTKAGGFSDAFVSVLNPTGSALVFSTYLGGTQADAADGIDLDGAANIYITGSTSSLDFPTTSGVLQPEKASRIDILVSKITAVAPTQPPIISGSTWYSDGSNAKGGGSGTTVRGYAVGAFENLAYLMILATSGCTTQVAVLNPNTRFANSSGFISNTVGTIPSGVQPGTYVICFKSTTGDPPTATGTVNFTVSS